MLETAPTKTKSIIVIGKESVGKSALIGALTGQPAIASNFRGSTISCEVYRSSRYEFVDTPGILRQSDTETTRAALQRLEQSDTVLLIAQATHLDSDLTDLLPLVRGRRCVIIATFWDKISRIASNDRNALDGLINELHIDIIPVDARKLREKDCTLILRAIDHAAELHLDSVKTKLGWLYSPPRSLLDHPLIGPVLATMLLFSPACFAIWAANTFAGIIDPSVETFLSRPASMFQNWPALIREILVGNYGLITMGPLLFVWAVPTVILYAVVLGAYKASGLLDRISMSLHPLVRHVGLSGRDLVRVLMGFGCNVPAVISTRACSSCSRSTAISTIAFGSACSYQFGATLGVFAAANRPYLIVPFLIYLAVTTLIYARLTSAAQARSAFNILVIEGRTFLVWPTLEAVWREASHSIRAFFRISLPIFFLITLIASIIAWTGALTYIATLVRPVMGLFRLPAEAALPVIMACIRKDGILLFAKYDRVANLTNVQLLTAVYLAGELLPCLVTALAIAREKSRPFLMRLLVRQAVAAVVFSLALAWTGTLL